MEGMKLFSILILLKFMLINGEVNNIPKVMISMFVSNSALYLENVLKFLEDQEYPKNKIGLLIRSDFNDGNILIILSRSSLLHSFSFF